MYTYIDKKTGQVLLQVNILGIVYYLDSDFPSVNDLIEYDLLYNFLELHPTLGR